MYVHTYVATYNYTHTPMVCVVLYRAVCHLVYGCCMYIHVHVALCEYSVVLSVYSTLFAICV